MQRAAVSIAALPMLNTASFIGTSAGSTALAALVGRKNSGTVTTSFRGSFGIREKHSGLPFLTMLMVKPPKIAGATLSGCPSISVAICKRSRLVKGLPKHSLAAFKPPTIAVALLPNPLDRGTPLSILIIAPLYSCALPALSKSF